MFFTDVYQYEFDLRQIAFGRFVLGIFLLLFLVVSIFSQKADLSQPDEKTIVINDAPEMEVFAIGKTVIVKNKVKGVLSLGGDVIVEGEVTEDVATIGGSIIQKEDAFIGGDVIIFGGKYKPEKQKPLRNSDKKTIMYAAYEEELRYYMQNPSQIFSPKFSIGFIVQRLLSVLLWFILSLALTTIAPGAISRAVARFQLSTLKVFGIGSLGFIITTLAVFFSLEFLPGFVSLMVALWALVLTLLAYIFGRVAIQAMLGKWILKKIASNKKQSETLALFIGAFVSTLLLSIPYIWVISFFVLFMASFGLILTARSTNNWEKA